MTSATSNLLQSKFFTPVFNTAIFDGPMRMYFAQAQEPDALRLYFRLQTLVSKIDGLGGFEPSEPHLFVMLYPNEETFAQSFEGEHAPHTAVLETLGNNLVVGLRGPVAESELDALFEQLEDELSRFKIANC
jgi:hypothetical protein